MIKAAVLGSPIAHSLSPLLHQCAYQELGIAGEYSKIELRSGELATFLASLDTTWTAFSLTMPLKVEVLEIASSVSAVSSRIKSANTLIKCDGVWHASTTDVDGFTHALQSNGVDYSGRVLIIGAGATARAAAQACDGIASHISVMARSARGASEMSDCVQTSELDFVLWADAEALNFADVIISTTPEAASDSLAELFPQHPHGVFFDVLYKPWPTVALSSWTSAGGRVIDGLELLIHQGISQVELFTQLTIERPSMSKLMRMAALNEIASST